MFDSGLFIKEYYIIAILYSDKIDFFDFNTLKYIGSEIFENGLE